jgi:hypothetical protein
VSVWITTGPAAEARLQVYPTTVNQALTSNYTAAGAEPLRVQLLDALGKAMVSPPVASVKPGFNRVSRDVATASGGLYVLRMLTAEGYLQRRVIIIR